MAATESFLATCRALIVSLPELTAFRALSANASTLRGWHVAYSDHQPGKSPAMRLRVAIREIVRGQAATDMAAADVEDASQRLAAEYVPYRERPLSEAEEAAVAWPFVVAALTQ